MILCMLMYLFFILECSLSVSLVTNACTYTPTVSLMPSVQGRIVPLLMLARGTHPPLSYKKVSQFEVDQCDDYYDNLEIERSVYRKTSQVSVSRYCAM